MPAVGEDPDQGVHRCSESDHLGRWQITKVSRPTKRKAAIEESLERSKQGLRQTRLSFKTHESVMKKEEREGPLADAIDGGPQQVTVVWLRDGRTFSNAQQSLEPEDQQK